VAVGAIPFTDAGHDPARSRSEMKALAMPDRGVWERCKNLDLGFSQDREGRMGFKLYNICKS
jgi:hypothetical protein